jgi:hypothetical protein
MTKAGIGEQTIILAIQRGPVSFDTSPQALIALKNAGVTDQVLNAILASATSKSQTSTVTQSADAHALFEKALDAIGPHGTLAAIHSYRWKGNIVQTVQGRTISFDRETVKIYPASVCTTLRTSTGQVSRQVITPEFSYRSSGKTTNEVPPADLETMRDNFWFDPIYVAQHAEDFRVTLPEENRSGSDASQRLQISGHGKNIIWVIDLQTGRLLSTSQQNASGEQVIEFSDWRMVAGVYVSFKRHESESGRISDFVVREYEINPVVDEALFERPAQNPSQGLTLKILQSQSVPYVQESGGGISTSCNIMGTANTSAYANTVGNSTFGNATTNSDQHMSCSSYDTTMRWPHILNVMFAQASDGNSYIIACDRAWRWSKCVSLRAGELFNARFTEKGIEVEAFNTKGKEENPTYHVLQSKASQ